VYATGVSRGERSQHAVIWGLDLTREQVDAIRLTGGGLPEPGQLLADAGDGSAASFPVGTGDRVTIGRRSLPVTGTARSLATSPRAFGSTNPVFYTDLATARALAGTRGVNTLAFRLANDNAGAAAQTVARVHQYLTA
jgi:hypothetical protein